MYTQFFQLRQAPFSIAPDPRYLFMSERHREALAHLLYGVGSGGGFVLLTGEIGAGKTTVCRCLLDQVPDNCQVAYIFNPKLSVEELLQTICEEFHIDAIPRNDAAASVKHYVDVLNAYLLHSHAAGKNNVLIIDEAQNLAPDVLEQLRLLTNLETSERKLLQVILIGQPELRVMLARPELEQLAQRVIARYHLDALSPQETAGYIQYRMSIAGAMALQPFPARLMPKIHRLTRGVPRRINLLCDRALLGAYAAGRTEVTSAIVEQAAREVFDSMPAAVSFSAHYRRHAWKVASVTAVILAGTSFWAWRHATSAPDPAVQAVLAQQAGNFKLSHSLAPFSTAAAPLPRLRPVQDPAPAAPSSMLEDAARDEATVFRLLGQLWGIALGKEEPCGAAQSRQVHCYRSAGGLDELRRLNRPAILKLSKGKLAGQHVLLTGLNDTSAELRIPGSHRNVRIGLDELAGHFNGEFISFWRAPPGYAGEIAPGDKGEAVDWLNAQLSRLSGGIESARGQPYSATMVRQVREFQHAHGLPVDGIVGARTIMLLNGVAGILEPQLQKKFTLAAAVRGE